MNVHKIETEEELEAAFRVRRDVFITEQHVPEADEFDKWDTLTSGAVHILAGTAGEPAGAARFHMKGSQAKLERICVQKAFRGRRLGSRILEKLEEEAVRAGASSSILHGQTHAEAFYHRHGYVTTSEPFDEDGIEHVRMEKTLR
ncbi:GNAT family N-acetyltransferase [Alkalicoccus urumqiensis]|uniref:GNAT family N-acetyltransferase n=1 Tax=Alkalicoccus urumqiensis TaxID=1548213 RepID=A0A2P6MHG6_ALKUR|nr:GNAT family N-acetyltransferase [Alkalicoccus urumqiensis]PRO65724.1 GNAT family N-acetyltransferase [Alkalicoccus urumqiensis]